MNPWAPLIAATVGWGASAVLNRAAILRGLDSWTIVPLRMVFAMITLGLVIALSGRFKSATKAAWWRGAILGVVGMALPMLLMTLGLEDIPVSLGGLLIALIPIATIGAAHFIVEDERFKAKALPGLILALLGSAFVVGVGGETVDGVDNLWRGVLFTIAGVAMAGLAGALSRKYALEVPGEELVLPQFTTNTLLLFAAVPFTFGMDIDAVDGGSWLLLIGVGAIGTTLAFGSFLVAAAINPARRLALTGYSVPVVAVTLAIIFLGERLTLAVATGAVLIITGVILTERASTHIPAPGVATSR